MPTSELAAWSMYMEVTHKKDLVIIKVGTNTLVKHSTNRLSDIDYKSFERIGGQAKELSASMSVMIVSSGGITTGALLDGRHRQQVEDMVDLQRYAAKGWDSIVQVWKRAIGAHRVCSALLTKRELHDAGMRQQALAVFRRCFEHDDVVVVNENDVISSDEIRFGDNDQLAAELACALQASGWFESVSLVLLTDKDGLNQVAHDDATLIRTVENNNDVMRFVSDSDSEHSRGGMSSKIMAAKSATSNGIATMIANGRREDVIQRALMREVGTYFLPAE